MPTNKLAIFSLSICTGYCFVIFGLEVWSFLNSSFATALFGAIAGSGTILFIESLRRQDELLKDANVSIMVLDGVLSTMLSMKKQIILPFKCQYERNLKTITDFREGRLQLSKGEKPVVSTGFSISMPPHVEVDIQFDKLKILAAHSPEIIRAIVYLKNYLADFKNIHANLMDYHAAFKESTPEDVIEFCYFFKVKGASSDSTYKDLVEAMALHADDVLWFSDFAMKEIVRAAKKELPFWLRNKIVTVDVSARYQEFMPPHDHVEKTQERGSRFQ